LTGKDIDCWLDVEAFLDLSPESEQIPLIKIKGHRNNGSY
jgi:hypothetical protein